MAGTTGSSGHGRPRKPAVGSRTPTSRPRTVAGRSTPAPDVDPTVVEPTEVEPTDVESPGVSLAKTPPRDLETSDVEPVEASTTDIEGPDIEGPDVESPDVERLDVETLVRSQRVRPQKSPRPVRSRPEPSVLARSGHGLTVALVATVVVLLGIGTWELATLLGDDGPSSNTTITADRPVRVDPLTVSSVVDQARTASEVILSASSDDYDGQVDKATAMMTTTFAKQYRETKEQIKDRFVSGQTAVTVDVSAQGVVSASPSEIVAMVFLTQSTTMRDTDLKVAQYRVRVTMLRDGDTWLVSQLDTI